MCSSKFRIYLQNEQKIEYFTTKNKWHKTIVENIYKKVILMKIIKTKPLWTKVFYSIFCLNATIGHEPINRTSNAKNYGIKKENLFIDSLA